MFSHWTCFSVLDGCIICLTSIISVVWKEKVWHCWVNIFCFKSSFACIWSNHFDDTEIFDKVIPWFRSPPLLVSIVSLCHSCSYLLWSFFDGSPMICSIHKGFCLRQGISSPISDLSERLLLEERDPAATPQESLYEAPPFDEVSHFTPLWQ